MNTICRRGVVIYPNGTGCTEVYLTKEEVKGEEVQGLSAILTIIVILCLAGIFAFIYKKFLKK